MGLEWLATGNLVSMKNHLATIPQVLETHPWATERWLRRLRAERRVPTYSAAGKAWTMAHERWLMSRHFDDPALAQTYSHYRAIVADLDAHLSAVESDLKCYLERGPFTEPVACLAAYRGVTELGALALSAEVCDPRRFPRATSLMGFCGLVPSEYSSGESTCRGRITEGLKYHLQAQPVESASPNRYRPRLGPVIKNASSAARPTPWPGPGTPNSTCAPTFAGWLSARAHAKLSSPRSPGSSLGLWGPRWPPSET